MSGFYSQPLFNHDIIPSLQHYPSVLDPAMYSQAQQRSSSPRGYSRSIAMSPQRFQRAQQAPGRLPTLPKFHPATYSSTESSSATSPSSELSSPSIYSPHAYAPSLPTAMSPRRQYSEAQRHLLQHQRDLIGSRGPRLPHARSPHPASPHLQPLGSPGPVTPLQLEEAECTDYLYAGASEQLSEQAKDQILHVYIEKEVKASGKRRRHHEEGRSRNRDIARGFEI